MTTVPVPRLVRRVAGALLLLVAVAALAPTGAQAQSIVNPNWLETSATAGQGGDASGRKIRMSFVVQHPAGREVDKVALDLDWNGDDNLGGGGTIIDVTAQKPSGGFNYSRVNVTADVSDSSLGGGFLCNGTILTDRTVRARAILDNGTRSSSSVSAPLRLLRTDANTCNDYPYLYGHTADNDKSGTPGQQVTYKFKGDDTDSGLTGERDWTGYRWRWRRTSDNATIGGAEVCGGNRDNTEQSITTNLPGSRGRWVIEAQLAAGNDGECNWKGEWNWVGAADVNSATSPSPNLSIPRPNFGETITATAAATDVDGEVQMLEWDADGDGAYERRETGTPTLASTQKQQAINTAGMSPGLKTVRVRATDNGALSAADAIRRDAVATATFRVDAAPVPVAVSARTWKGEAIPVTFAATDPDGDAVTYTLQTQPTNGTVTGTGASRTYTPNAGFSGTDTFTYKATSAYGASATASVTVTVFPDSEITSGPEGFSAEASATFTLAGAAGLSFECKLDDGEYVTCGSPVVFNSLEDGEHTLSVRGVDSLGNREQNPATRTWTVYTGPLGTAITSGPATFTKARTATFAFASGYADATFTCQLDDAPAAPCSTGQAYAGLEDGLHTLKIVATRQGQSGPPATYTWTVDNVAPPTTILSGPAADTQSTTASFTFNSEAGATFACSIDGGAYAACDSPLELTGVSEGTHVLRVQAIDQAGNVDPDAAERTWNVDTTAPGVSLTGAPAGTLASSRATITFASDDPTARVECALDGGDFAACFSPHELDDLEDGAHVLKVRAVDAAGNASADETASWTSDATAPATTISAGPSGTRGTTGAQFAFTADDADATFECRVDAGTWQACTSPHDLTNLAEGAHTFRVRATDAVGNVETTPASRTWIVDTGAPALVVDERPGTQTNDTTPTVTFSSPDADAAFECRLTTPAATGDFVACTSPWTQTLADEGAYALVVRAVDAAENRSAETTVTWTLDTTKPVTSVSAAPASPTAATSATFTLGPVGSSFTCKVDDGPARACTSPATIGGLADGAHTLEVVASDAAGNQGDPVTRTWTVATTVPLARIVRGPSGIRTAQSNLFEFEATTGASPVFACSLNGGAFAVCDTPYAPAISGDGQYTLRVKVQGTPDAVAASRSWIVDTAAPDTAIVSGPPTSSSAARATFTFAATETGASYECQLDGGAWKGCPATHVVDVAVGAHALAVRAIDEAGNADASPATYGWTVVAAAAASSSTAPGGAGTTPPATSAASTTWAPKVTGRLTRAGAVELTAASGSVALKAVDFTLPTGAALKFAAPARGKQIGTLVLTGAGGKRIASHRLTLPKQSNGTATLLSKGGLKVTLKAGSKPVVKITGLPAGVLTATVKVNGGKRKLLAPAKGCTTLKPTGRLTPQTGAARTLKGDAACGATSKKKGASR